MVAQYARRHARLGDACEFEGSYVVLCPHVGAMESVGSKLVRCSGALNVDGQVPPIPVDRKGGE